MMFHFYENIAFINGNCPLLDFHEQRFMATQLIYFGDVIAPSLRVLLEMNMPNNLQRNQVYNFHISYGNDEILTSFFIYKYKKIRSLQLLIANNLSYGFKNEDRSDLDNLRNTHLTNLENQDILIVKNGLITDTAYCNVAFEKMGKWFTPKLPLLSGIRRMELLQNGIIHEADITLKNINNFSKIKIFNSLVNWDIAQELPIKSILPLK